jgi:hypothetical protein
VNPGAAELRNVALGAVAAPPDPEGDGTSQPLRGRRAELDEKHPGEVLNHMQQGRLRAHSLTPATAGKEGTNVTNEVGLCCATKMSTDRPEPA